jgi:hypothetical protein
MAVSGHEFYEEDWSTDEKLLFDEYVKEEMRRLESAMKEEFHETTGSKYENPSAVQSPLRAQADSYRKLHNKHAGSSVMATQEEWNAAQKNINFEQQGSLQNSRPQNKYADDGRAGQSSNHVNINFDSKAVDHRGQPISDKMTRQQEYARQLRADQAKNAAISVAAAPKRDSYYAENRDQNQQPRFERGMSNGSERSDSRNSYSGGKGFSDASPREESGYSKSTMLGHSGRNVFSGPVDPASEAEMKRLKQKKYFEELAASATAAPITAERHSLRKAPIPTNEGVGLDIGGIASSGYGMKSEKQRQYAEQIAQASNQAPISAEHVRRNRTKAEVGGGSGGYGGADILASPAKHLISRKVRSDVDFDSASPREQGYYGQVPASTFPVDRVEGVDARRLKQQEYARQLQEDSSRGPLQSPRAPLNRRTRSPDNLDANPLNPRSPSGVFARGLSGAGPTTSAGQRRDHQRQYAEALERDRVDKASITSRTLGSNNSRTLSSVGDSGGFSSQDRQPDNKLSQRERQKQYAEALDRDRTTAPISNDRANMIRVTSPNSGTSRIVPNTYGQYPVPQSQSGNKYLEADRSGTDRVYAPPPQPSFSGNTGNQAYSYDDDAEMRYQQFAEKIRQERKYQEDRANYPQDVPMRPNSGHSHSNPAGARGPAFHVTEGYQHGDQYSTYQNPLPVGGMSGPGGGGRGGEYLGQVDSRQSAGNASVNTSANNKGFNSSAATSIFGREDAARSERSDSRLRGRSSGGGASSFSIGGR